MPLFDGLEWIANIGRWRITRLSRMMRKREFRRMGTRLLKKSLESMQSLNAEWLDSRDIGFLQFQIRTIKLLKNTALESYLIYGGGSQNLDSFDYLDLGRFLRKEYGFLRQYFAEIKESGRRPDRKQLERRLTRYMQRAVKVARSMARTSTARKRGHEYEIRLLTAGYEHCRSCVRYAARGVQILGALPAIGQDCECANNCKCVKVTAKYQGDLRQYLVN